MDAYQEAAQINGGDNPFHYHSIDRVITHDSLDQIQAIQKITNVTTSTYTATLNDDIILVGVTSTITLPTAKNGNEIEVVNTGAASTITIVPTGTDTVLGTTSVLSVSQWDALHFKAISGGWILI